MQWPLTGRDDELRALERILTSPHDAGVILAGPAGVGKTRLAAELRDRMGARPTDWVSASSSAAGIPLGAFAPILPRPPRDRSETVTMLQDAARAIAARGEGATLILFIDDAHHLDNVSATLVHQMVAQRACTVVATIRTGDVPPDAILSLWKDHLLPRLDIHALTRDAAALLVRRALDGEVERPLLQELWALSHGNPLFLRELVAGGVSSGAIALKDGLWRRTRRLFASQRLTEIVKARLSALSREETTAVQVLAFGEPLGAQVLERMAAPGTVEELEHREIVRVERSDQRADVRFAHPLYAEVVRATMPRTQARRVQRDLAEASTAAGSMRWDDAIRVATWCLEGGGSRDPALFTAAARHALMRFDPALGRRLARAAVEAGGGFDARLALGETLAAAGDVEASLSVFADAQASASQDAERARAALALGSVLFFQARDPVRAVATLERADAAIVDPAGHAEIGAMRSLFASMLGDLHTTAAVGAELLTRPDVAPRPLVNTIVFSTIADVMLGHHDRALDAIARVLPIAATVRAELPMAEDLLGLNEVMALAYSGRIREAVDRVRAGYRDALESRAPERIGMWGTTAGEILFLHGAIPEAARTASEAMGLSSGNDVFGMLPVTIGIDAMLRALSSDLEGARARVASIPAETLERDARAVIWRDRATVWSTAMGGDPTLAAEMATVAGERAIELSHRTWGSLLLYDAVRLGRPELVLAQLQKLAQDVDGSLIRAFVAHAEALHDDDADALSAVSGDLERMDAILFAAVAAAQAARVQHRAGDPARIRQLGARAALLRERCGGIRTPALVQVRTLGLTDREQQIASMAAAGMSSAEIAERLVLSTRTVDNHLASVYRKLGLSGRAQLAETLGAPAPRSPS